MPVAPIPLPPNYFNWNGDNPVPVGEELFEQEYEADGEDVVEFDHHEPVPMDHLDAFLKTHILVQKKEELKDTLNTPIDNFYGRNTKQRYLKEIAKVYTENKQAFTINNKTLIGIEVEVENIPNKVNCNPIWIYKEDGSLRNDGIEYVSRPIEAHYVPAALAYLKKSLHTLNNPKYTSRTSIHVHVNVQDMTFKQIQAFTILYLCFESVLYSYAGNNRNKSIFCVPLSHAGYVHNLREFFSHDNTTSTSFLQYFKGWHKYTGFNLHPIHTFGTVEFRHLSGTEDIEAISKWVSLILALKEAALIYKLEDLFKVIAELNTNSEYYIFASNIFKDSIQYIHNNNLQDMMEKDISHIKECFFPPTKKEITPQEFEGSAFFKIHKIQKVEPVKNEYSGVSLDTLEKMLKDLYIMYHKSYNEKERNAISKKYGEVNEEIKKRKLNQSKKTSFKIGGI